MEEKNLDGALNIALTIIGAGLAVIIAPIVINKISSYIYRKQKVRVKTNKNFGVKVIKKKK